MITDIVSQLKRDEGEVLSAYKCSLGYLTIGVGRLIDPKRGGGITRAESAYLLANDIAKVKAQLTERLPWWLLLDEARQGILIGMAFQMGIDGLCAFKNTLEHVRANRWAEASEGMLESKWAKQTPERAKRLAAQMLDGAWR